MIMTNTQEALQDILARDVAPFTYDHASKVFRVGSLEVSLEEAMPLGFNGHRAIDDIEALSEIPVVLDADGSLIALSRLTRGYLPSVEDKGALRHKTMGVMREAHRGVTDPTYVQFRPAAYEVYIEVWKGLCIPDFRLAGVSHLFPKGYGDIAERVSEEGIFEYGSNNDLDIPGAYPALIAGLGHLACLASREGPRV
jgi:hypothetical protein